MTDKTHTPELLSAMKQPASTPSSRVKLPNFLKMELSSLSETEKFASSRTRSALKLTSSEDLLPKTFRLKLSLMTTFLMLSKREKENLEKIDLEEDRVIEKKDPEEEKVVIDKRDPEEEKIMKRDPEEDKTTEIRTLREEIIEEKEVKEEKRDNSTMIEKIEAEDLQFNGPRSAQLSQEMKTSTSSPR